MMTEREIYSLSDALRHLGAEALMRADYLVNRFEHLKMLTEGVADDLEEQFRAYEIWVEAHA